MENFPHQFLWLNKWPKNWMVASNIFHLSTRLGEIIQFDHIVIFKWVGSTTNQMEISYRYLEDHPMICSKWLIIMLIVSPPTGATFPFLNGRTSWLINWGRSLATYVRPGMILQVHTHLNASQKRTNPRKSKVCDVNFLGQIHQTRFLEGKIQVTLSFKTTKNRDVCTQKPARFFRAELA